jgi:transcriptional regulator with XRE-family HTH domain
MNQSLGKRISELRKRKGITQDGLAEEMGVSSQAVSKWENDISCPDIGLLPQLADFFGVTLDELMRGNQEKAARLVPENERKDPSKMIMRIKVLSADGDKVRVNLPMAMVKMGLDSGMLKNMVGSNESLKGIDFDSLMHMVEQGAIGKLVEVESADGDLVDITIE